MGVYHCSCVLSLNWKQPQQMSEFHLFVFGIVVVNLFVSRLWFISSVSLDELKIQL
jgi:hypothetical protein